MMQSEKIKKMKEDALEGYCQKVAKVQKVRQETQKQIKAMAVNPEKIGHKERLAEINRMKEEQARQMQRKIREGIKQREKQVDRNMSYLREENERRKEVKHLHKIDQ